MFLFWFKLVIKMQILFLLINEIIFICKYILFDISYFSRKGHIILINI